MNAGTVAAGSLVALFVLHYGAVSFANSDDTTLRGLRVTVTTISDFDVTIQVAGQGSDSSLLPSARLGSEFFYDYTYYSGLNNWIDVAPPAIDWPRKAPSKISPNADGMASACMNSSAEVSTK